MTSHTCRSGHLGILADECPRCDQHAEEPMLLGLDSQKTEQLWNKMMEVEFLGYGNYQSGNEAKACEKLRQFGVWLERYGFQTPFQPWDALRDRLQNA